MKGGWSDPVHVLCVCKWNDFIDPHLSDVSWAAACLPNNAVDAGTLDFHVWKMRWRSRSSRSSRAQFLWRSLGFCSVQLQDQSMKRGDHPCSCCFHHARTGRKPSLLPKRKTIARDLGHSGLCFTKDSWGYFRRTRSSSCLAFWSFVADGLSAGPGFEAGLWRIRIQRIFLGVILPLKKPGPYQILPRYHW